MTSRATQVSASCSRIGLLALRTGLRISSGGRCDCLSAAGPRVLPLVAPSQELQETDAVVVASEGASPATPLPGTQLRPTPAKRSSVQCPRLVPMRRVATIALLTVMAIGLSGCGAGEPEDRSADGAPPPPKAVEMCVDVEPVIGQVLQYLNNENNSGNGPFKRAGNWCGESESPGGVIIADVDIIAEVTGPDGTNVFRVAGSNPTIGYPAIQVTCRDGSPSDPNHSEVRKRFSEGETISFTCNPYTIVATREADSRKLKHFQLVVRPR